MKTKCIVVDDEPLARDLLRSHIEKLDNIEVVAECGDAIKAFQALREKQVDLISRSEERAALREQIRAEQEELHSLNSDLARIKNEIKKYEDILKTTKGEERKVIKAQIKELKKYKKDRMAGIKDIEKSIDRNKKQEKKTKLKIKRRG